MSLLLAGVDVGTSPLTEHQVLVFLVQIALLVGTARLLGSLARRINQPPVVGELLAGVVLGPSVFEQISPAAFEWVFTSEPAVSSAVFAMAWLGVVLLLVVMGYETDLEIISRFRKAALAVAAGSLVLPMVATGLFGLAVASRLGADGVTDWVFAGFFALGLSVSALPVVGKILHDLGFLRRNFGQVTIAAAMAKDAVGWLILAVLTGVAIGGVDVGRIVVSFAGLAIVTLLILTVGRWLFDAITKQMLARGSGISAGLTLALVAALVGGAATQALHVEAILGAYLVGLALSLGRYRVPGVRHFLETLTTAFFAPVFFAYSGLRVDVTALGELEAAGIAAAAVALAVLSKVLGSYLSGRMVGVERREALALGAGLSPLGVMGVVVAIIGLNTGVFSEQGYTVLVLAAVVTSLLAPLLLRLAVRGWVPDREEAERLERESLIEESEILRATKVLLPTRGGANSEYAARLVALAFGTAEVTVLAIKVPDVKRSFWRRRADIGSSDPESVLSKLGDGRNRVISRVARDPAEAIARESRLGYDILVMGASDRSVGGTGGPTTTVVDRVVGHTGVPTIVLHAGEGAALSPEPPRRILVPITASRSTRAAEEFAYSLARATRAEVTALHVINRPDGGASYAVPEGEFDSAAAGAELARTAAEFGLRLGVAVTTEIRRAFNAEQEIVEYAKQIEADLLVLGASTRPLTRLPFFGHRINYMIERAGIPVAVIAMPSN